MQGMESITSLTTPRPTRADRQDDRDLVARFQAGETAALDEIVAAHQGRIVRLTYRLLGGPDEVEDVVQEVFLSVLQNLKRFRGECTFSTWLTRIAVNKSRSHLRRRLLRLRALPWAARSVRMAPDEKSHVEAAETRRQVHRAVQNLPAKYREPVVLRYFEEMSIPQISEILGISVGAVEVRLSRARGRLKKTWT